jgi:hypothetical protein
MKILRQIGERMLGLVVLFVLFAIGILVWDLLTGH